MLCSRTMPRPDIDAHNRLLNQLKETYRSGPIVLDGPVDAKLYCGASPRILWVLKEAHLKKKDGKKSGFDLREFLGDEPHRRQSTWGSTFSAVTKVSYGLLKNKKWGTWAKSPRSLVEYLRYVAVININKRGGDARSKAAVLERGADKFAVIVAKQIRLLRPDVLIAAGTRKLLGDVDSSVALVKAYHPGQRTITHEDYYREIREQVGRLAQPS